MPYSCLYFDFSATPIGGEMSPGNPVNRALMRFGKREESFRKKIQIIGEFEK
jgi:hypothetical protein